MAKSAKKKHRKKLLWWLELMDTRITTMSRELYEHRAKMTERHKEIREVLDLRPVLAAFLASAAKPSQPDGPDSPETDAPSSDQTQPSS